MRLFTIEGLRAVKLHLIANPASGRGKGVRYGRSAADLLTQLGHEVVYFQGSSASESSNFIRESLGHCDGLVVSGGDGLIHLAIQHLAESQTPLGIIPSGTGNDAARSLGIPLNNPEAAAAIIAAGTIDHVDLGRAEDSSGHPHWFLQILSTGFDSVVNENANARAWPKGRMKYNIAMLTTLPRFKPIKYELVVDGAVHSFSGMLVAIANGPSYGGGMLVCPDASFTDGQLDVMMLQPLGKLRFLALFPRVYRGTHILHPRVSTLRTASLRLTGEATSYADGERIGALPVSVSAVPGALRIWRR